MSSSESLSLGVLAERVEGIRDDVMELRAARRDDHHRLRTVEAAVEAMATVQRAAREAADQQSRRMANAIAFGGLTMSMAMVVLAVVTILYHSR